MNGLPDKYCFYFAYLDNYSEKAYMIEFAFINKKGKLRKSSPWFLPKSVVKFIDFDKKIIGINPKWIGKNSVGFLFHYSITKEHNKPVEKLDLKNNYFMQQFYIQCKKFNLNYSKV